MTKNYYRFRKLRKYAAVAGMAVVLTVSLSACKSSTYSTSNNSTSTVSTSESTSTSEASTSVYGKVTAIDGSSITLALGELQQGMGTPPEGGQSGEPPAKPGSESSDNSLESSSDSSSESSTAPSTDTSTDSTASSDSSDSSTQGNAPDGAPGGMGSSFTESGETLSITVEDESIIKVQSGSDSTQGSLSDIAIDSILYIEYADDGSISAITVQQAGGMSAPGGSSSGSETGSITLTGAYTVDATEETSTDETIEATEANQNAVLVQNGGSLTLTGATLNKAGDTTSDDESNFYAVNSILAATGGSSVTVSDTTLTSVSEGSNAIFATGEGSNITVSNVTIRTTGDSSRGLDATYGGTVTATNVNITTTGAHCAPVATDRGEGTITVSDSTLSAAGDGSPCIYSTGDITATNVVGTATGSQTLVVEGKNSITLSNCDLTGAGKNGLMLYQSTSGDAADGTCVLTATDSTLTSTSTGEMIYVTNTDAEIDLTNTTLTYTSGILLNAAGNDTNNWGTPGSNGATVVFNATKQVLEGDITCDAISTVAMNLTDSSTLTGAIDTANTGDVTITLDSSSKWKVTADSYISAITDEDDSLSNIVSNGHTIYYDSSNSANTWLNGKTVSLSDGGTLTPME